ncbi:MAG: hypothetical protein ACLP1X_24880 [Polyangiaceae bacterium]
MSIIATIESDSILAAIHSIAWAMSTSLKIRLPFSLKRPAVALE